MSASHLKPQLGWNSSEMADQVIKMFFDGCTVNLGIGMPTKIAERIPSNMDVMIHSENGVLGVGGRPNQHTVSATLINAGKETISIKKGASFFDSALSFGMIRGGHIDFCVLGAMEVDVEGSLANWMIPGKKVTGMGGAMDLVNGAKEIIVMLQHFTPRDEVKLVERCTLPLTGKNVVQKIVTNLGVFVPKGTYFEIVKLAPGVTPQDLRLPASIFRAAALPEREITL